MVMPVSATMPRSVTRIMLVLACMCTTALALLAVAGCIATEKPQLGTKHPEVTVIVARRKTVPQVVRPIGTTRALQEVAIRARVKGFLEQKHFEDGKNVKKGQLLLVIEEKPYQVVLDQAKAQLAAANASLEKAKASKQNLVSRARLALDQAQLSLDEIEERRERSLLARKAVSQEDYDKAIAQRKKSAAQVDADQASLEQAEADFQIGIASALADVERAAAAVEDAKLNLSYCKMFSPIDGRIGELQYKLGNLVGDGSANVLVTIEQLDPMGLDLRPASRYLPIATALTDQGLAVNISVDAPEGERHYPYTGKTIFIDNKVDENTSTFLARAEVPNPEGAILPGQYIKATLTVGEYFDAVLVPEQAVLEGQEGTRVYIVDAENKVQIAKVQAVDNYKGLRVLESGVEPNQKVIVEGIQLVRPGQVVKPVEVPLENYETDAAASLYSDPRYTSKVSRVPGMSRRPDPTEPAAKPAGPEPKKAEPEPKKTEPGPAAGAGEPVPK
jgi:membrane fusion protein, multidrug efflux system